MGTDRERLLKMAFLDGETIHSGQFMASNVHEFKPDDDEEIDVISDSGMEPPDPEVTPDTKDDKPVTFYKFGPETTRSIAIDVSLTKLNKCIQIAYEKGKLTTPKWKSFKGMKLQWKDRIRLNNVIWRAYYMQFVQNNKPKYCFFSVPEDDYTNQSRSEASVLEGMYWKRRLETVCAQYTRWRHYYFKQGKRRRSSVSRENRRGSESDTRMNLFDDEILFPTSFTPLTFDNDDDFTSWFTDTLFSSLNQPYMFPNPKQFAQSDNADLMQPGLIQLQPSLEEIMASLVSESSSNFLSSDNDPSLASTEQMDHTNSVDDTNLDSLRSSSVAGPSSSTSSSKDKPFQYTSKDYDDASLLVNYSERAATGSAQTSVLPSPEPTGRPVNILPPQIGYQNESGFPIGPCYPSTPGSFCEPYVPQMLATSDTIHSQQVQYTVAKTWQEDAPPVITMPTIKATNQLEQSQQQSPRRMSDNGIRKGFSDPPHQQLTQQNSLNFDTSMKQCRSAPVTEGLLKVTNNVTKSRRPPKKKDEAKILPSVVVERKSSDKSLRTPTSNYGMAPAGKHAGTFSSTTQSSSYHFTQPPGISVNCDSLLPNEPLLSYNNTLFSSPTSSTSSQNSNVLRPIPISFGRTDQSAFSPLSPSGSFVHSTNVQSPMQQQRSPSSSASANDLFRNIGGGTPTPSTTLVHMSSAGGSYFSGVSSNAQSNPPVLILQSLGGVQFPMLALPYSTASTTFPSAVPKQEPLDKIPVSVYNPLSYAQPAASTVVSLKTTTLSSSVKQELQSLPGHSKSIKPKSTKRAADSTVDPVERKRMQHLFAEQSRRSALKNGFELLEELLPDFNSTNTKATNALVLMKSAERIRELKDSTNDNARTISQLKAEIQELNDKIGAHQNRLPVPTSSPKLGYLQQKHTAYVKQRSQFDSKFWLLHKIMEPLFESFKTEVQGSNVNELYNSAHDWAAKHCNHAELRPVVSQLLVSLATDSPILSDPSSFGAYAFTEASKL